MHNVNFQALLLCMPFLPNYLFLKDVLNNYYVIELFLTGTIVDVHACSIFGELKGLTGLLHQLKLICVDENVQRSRKSHADWSKFYS